MAKKERKEREKAGKRMSKKELAALLIDFSMPNPAKRLV